MRRVGQWVEDRTGLAAILQAFLDRSIPQDIGWPHVFGSALLFLMAIQFVTGVLLALNYAASPASAYASVEYLQKNVLFGGWLRGIHLWSASAIVLLLGVHMVRTFLYGAYKFPRELTWLTGVGLFLVVLAFSFTGYLLPWDQKAYWATVVGTNIAGAAPLIGGLVLRLLRAGTAVGAATLVRFYAFHVLILPALLMLFVAGHLFMVIRQGIAAPPRLRPLVQPEPRESVAHWYWREYAEEKRRGKPFYEALWKDAITAAGVFVIILVLGAFVGAPLGEPANPNSTTYVPRPEWYFLDVFQLLWYVKGSIEPLGLFVVPTVFVLLLLALPFLDRGRERHPLHRPIATAAVTVVVVLVTVMTYLGVTTSAPVGAPPVTPGRLSPEEAAGAKLFSQEGCINCHTIGGVGGAVGPDLSHVGRKLRRSQIIQTITSGKGGMPAFRALTPQQIDELAAYLRSRR